MPKSLNTNSEWADQQDRIDALEARLEAAEKERDAAVGKAALADDAQPMIQLALQDCEANNLILHIPMHREWLARYDALSAQQAEQEAGDAN